MQDPNYQTFTTATVALNSEDTACHPVSSSSSPAVEGVVPFEPIAIVGVGMRVPGGIDSLASLWDTLIQGKSHHACLATDPRFLRRFNPEDFSAMFSVTPDARTTLHGNLLDETPALDEAYFGVNKRESACMEAQQKLLLHVAHEALEDAGFSGARDGSAFDPATFGVYVGSATDNFFKDPNSYSIDLYHLVRTQRAFLSGQISHHFGLHGPSVSVDTVCAGAMTAFNDACRALATGECRAALAGGVHVMTPVSAPPTVMSLKLAGFLDPTGQCKPFLADGQGYCRAEGCGLAVLKRLSDAIRDGDRIHGVIRGIGVGNMSSARSIVRPDGFWQSVALARAVASSGIDPTDISFVEAHGPGTRQGDPAEIFSVCSVLAQQGSRQNPSQKLVIGSVKASVGHSEAASGATSLFKVLAMMRYRRIPPQAGFHLSNLNPSLNQFFAQHPIRINDSEEVWSASRRIAVVSNFGASGYAGHMVVEDYSPFVPSRSLPLIKSLLLPFMISAKDKSTLLILAQNYADWLDNEGAYLPLSDISYATTTRRIVQPFFTLLQAVSAAELAQQLRQDTLPIVDASSTQPRTLAFCFSGQGGPRLDPRQSSLYGISNTFTSTVDTCFQVSETEQLVSQDDVEILELFALHMGLAEMWNAWGVTATALAGHSFGEYAALVSAGVLTLRDALKLVGIRASLIRDKCLETQSKMAALRLSLPAIFELLRQQQTTRIELACINSEGHVTLAGTPEDLNIFREQVLEVYPTSRWQLVDRMKAAFHSRFMEPLCEEFSKICRSVDFHPSKTTVLSGPLGRTCLPGDDALQQPDYLVRHCRETNRFGEAFLDYKKHSETVSVCQPDWIELGPHSTTIGFIPLSSGRLKLPTHHKGVDGWTITLDTLTKLWAAGHSINFVAFHRDINSSARHIDLPRYPFRLQPHSYPVRKKDGIPHRISDSIQCPRVTSADLSQILAGHVVANRPICPASVYIALVLAASVNGPKDRLAFRLSRLSMTTPFTGLTDDWLQARTSSSSSGDATSTFDVISKHGRIHASMSSDICQEATLLDSLSLLKPLVFSMSSFKNLPGTSVLNKRLAYDLFSQTVRYGPHGQGLHRVWIAEDGRQAWAFSSNDPEETTHRLDFEPACLRSFSPTLIDRACQLVGLLINTSSLRMQDEIFVASQIDQVEIAFSKLRESSSFESYASFELTEGSGTDNVSAIGQVFTFDQDQRLVAAFRGVRMRRMKRGKVEYLVRWAYGESSLPTPVASPKRVQSPPKASLTPVKVVDNSLDNQLCEKVSAIVQNTLGVADIPVDKALDELGLDSLTAVEIGVELERLLPGSKLSNELLVKPNTTISTLFKALHLSSADKHALNPATAHDVVSLSDPNNGSPTSLSGMSGSMPDVTSGAVTVFNRTDANPEVIQDKPGTTPLILIHDGGGTAFAYRLLGNLGHTLLGIHSPRLHEDKGIVSICHAADQYASLAQQWLTKTSHRPQLLVGGWSLGGIIALALAAARPELVCGVILLDPPPPGTAAMRPAEAERLIPVNTCSLTGLGERVRMQLKMNAESLSADADYCGNLKALFARLKAPVYLISAIEPLCGSKAEEAEPPLAGSCSAWMLSPDRARIAEATWREALGDLLVGTGRTAGDHFTMFSRAHATSTTRAVQQAIGALKVRLTQDSESRMHPIS